MNPDFVSEPCPSISPPTSKIRLGGGAKAIERQHAKGRLTARERIAKLIDPETDFFELGLWAALEHVRRVGRRAVGRRRHRHRARRTAAA